MMKCLTPGWERRDSETVSEKYRWSARRYSALEAYRKMSRSTFRVGPTTTARSNARSAVAPGAINKTTNSTETILMSVHDGISCPKSKIKTAPISTKSSASTGTARLKKAQESNARPLQGTTKIAATAKIPGRSSTSANLRMVTHAKSTRAVARLRRNPRQKNVDADANTKNITNRNT